MNPSKEVFKVGDLVTWGKYLDYRPSNSLADGPFIVTEVKFAYSVADSAAVLHSQLIKIKGDKGGPISSNKSYNEDNWFSGAWFTKLKFEPKNLWRRIEL
jgi:hypothetical protein